MPGGTVVVFTGMLKFIDGSRKGRVKDKGTRACNGHVTRGMCCCFDGVISRRIGQCPRGSDCPCPLSSRLGEAQLSRDAPPVR